MAVTSSVRAVKHHYLTYTIVYDGVVGTGTTTLLIGLANDAVPGPLQDELSELRQLADMDIAFGGDRVDVLVNQVGSILVGINNTPNVNIIASGAPGVPQLAVDFDAIATPGGITVTLRYVGRMGVAMGR